LVSHSSSDDSFSHESGSSVVSNFGGAVGAHLSDLLFFIAGYSAYALLGLSFFMLWRARKMVDAIELPGFNEPLPKWIAWVRPIGFLVLWVG
ncbi:DNA translocase FtsK 4TM domain-containing protein, partial [Salmonella enterica subsp. enterica]|uniref:DNA translocase FtsK 4TM domain-containing protein n=2 Tax=Pseudomonadota TaxID=1224 RepID=UPI0022B64CEF